MFLLLTLSNSYQTRKKNIGGTNQWYQNHLWRPWEKCSWTATVLSRLHAPVARNSWIHITFHMLLTTITLINTSVDDCKSQIWQNFIRFIIIFIALARAVLPTSSKKLNQFQFGSWSLDWGSWFLFIFIFIVRWVEQVLGSSRCLQVLGCMLLAGLSLTFLRMHMEKFPSFQFGICLLSVFRSVHFGQLP